MRDRESRVVEKELPCPCGRSSDAYFTYDDGHSYCFSCHKDFQPATNNKKDIDEYMNDNKNTYQYISTRGITENTMKFYDVKTSVDATGAPTAIGFPYHYNNFKALKVRQLHQKKYNTLGDGREVALFGHEKFSPGQAKAITITEGEFDALATYQMLGSKYPVVSVRSSSQARKDCEKCFDFLDSFEHIYLCFDNDQQGQDAVKEVAALFNPNKVFHVKLGRYKDANEYLEQGHEKEFVQCWWNAKKYTPKGVLSTWKEIEALLEEDKQQAAASYPHPTLQDMTYGIRTGEVVLVTAQEKVGKTEFLRSIEHHLLKTTDDNIGIIHLEEGERRAVEGLVGYELGLPAHLPDVGLSSSDLVRTFKELTKRDDRLYLYSHFGSENPRVILNTIRYLVAVCGCKYIFLDHITMIVTGNDEDDERKTLDFLSTSLATLTQELDFCLFLVSHVNDDGKTRGSRNISKIAHLLLHLDRDIETPDEKARNHMRLMIRGNRFASKSGPAGVLEFDPSTFKLSEVEPIELEETLL